MDALRALIAALRFGATSLGARPRHALLIAAGLWIASFTLLAVLTLPAGLERLIGRTGSDRIAVVLAGSGRSESEGQIDPERIARIGALAGVVRDRDGAPLIAPQFVVTTRLQRRDGSLGTLLLRGVSPSLWRVAQDTITVDGDRPRAGQPQLLAGRAVVASYPFTQPGAELSVVTSSFTRWQVTGTLRAHDGLFESELWADLDALRAEFNAPGQTTALWVRLTAPAAFETFRTALASDPRLRGFTVVRQDQFYAQRVIFLLQFVRVASLATALMLGAMAILAGNSAVGLALRARRRELALLRAIGFGPGVLFVALLAEVLLLALACALVAAAIVTLLLQAQSVDSGSNGLSIHFQLAVTPGIVALTLGYTAVLGLAAAIVPAWRVLRAPLVSALARE